MPAPRYGTHRVFLTWNDDHVTPLTLRTVRWLTMLAFGGYAVSRVLERAFLGTWVEGLLSNLIGLAAAVSMLLALSSRAQRLFMEDEGKLDEYQRSRRNAVTHGAYVGLGSLAVLVGVYLQIGADYGWPLPSSRDTLGDVGFGLAVLACLLPVTILVSSLDPAEDPEAPEVDDKEKVA